MSEPGSVHIPDHMGDFTFDDLLGINPSAYERVDFSTTNLKNPQIKRVPQLHWDLDIDDPVRSRVESRTERYRRLKHGKQIRKE